MGKSNVIDNNQVQVREGLMVFLICLSLMLAVMNTTMFNLALPSLSKQFGLPSSSTSWLVTGYSIIFAIASITYSRLSDWVNVRKLFIIALTLLSISSIVGCFSANFIILLISRLVQAAGAGAIPALSLIGVNRFVSNERRGKAMAFTTSAVTLAFGLGPVIGGAIVQYLGWQYLFILPALTLFLVPIFFIFLPKEDLTKGSFDLLGALLISIGSSSLLFVITYHSLLALFIGLVVLVLFTIRIRKVVIPFVQPELFCNRSYLLLIAVGIGSYICNFSTLFLMPQILIKLFGLNAALSGLIIFPGSLLAIIVSRKVGQVIDFQGNKNILRFIPSLILISTILFALFLTISYITILLIFIPLSVGFTAISSSVSNEITRLLPKSQISAGLGLYQLLQFFSGAYTIGIFANVLSLERRSAISSVYSSLYWGLSVVMLLVICCSYLYRKQFSKHTTNYGFKQNF
ncbi:MFS transporter [Priestia megaterium]